MFIARYSPFTFHCQKDSQGTLVKLSTRKDFINLEKHLTNMEVPYTLLPNFNSKPYRIVLKGLDPYIDPEEIASSLTRLGLKVQKVSPMTSFRTRKRLPMFLADLEDTPMARLAQDIETVCCYKVQVEEYIPRQIPSQCGRCQAYFHTTTRCRALPPPSRCRYCGEKHLTKDCNAQDYPPVCLHCNGEHTANYRGCPIYQEILNRTPYRKPQQQRTPPDNQQAAKPSSASAPQRMAWNIPQPYQERAWPTVQKRNYQRPAPQAPPPPPPHLNNQEQTNHQRPATQAPLPTPSQVFPIQAQRPWPMQQAQRPPVMQPQAQRPPQMQPQAQRPPLMQLQAQRYPVMQPQIPPRTQVQAHSSLPPHKTSHKENQKSL